MFWQKKRPSGSACPPVDNIDQFVDWLLRHSDDFASFRATAHASAGRFVKEQSRNILDDLDAHGDSRSLEAYIASGCDEYIREYQTLVDTAGGLQNLPSHIHNRAFPLLVKLRALMYVMRHRDGAQLSEPMLALTGPLQEI